MDMHRVIETLKKEEGFRASAYRDSLGYLTIGYGTMIDARKGGTITRDEGQFLLENRAILRADELKRLIPFWGRLDDPRGNALVMMAYQMGAEGVMGFRKMLLALEGGDFEAAATEALDSRWAKQTPARAERMAALIRDGKV